MKNKKIIITVFILSLMVFCNSLTTVYGSPEILKKDTKTALVLNADESRYGSEHCMEIIDTLESLGYEVTYLADEAVSLSFVRYNLTADVIYYNTHAGYWDTDGDDVSDSVIIGVGEKWTNDIASKYPFEYSNGMIFEGTVGGESYVAFTPSFIEYYYDDFHGSLVYMATCHATFDDSMANAFLDANASVYFGWTQNTVFWTNSFTSIVAFKLFSVGFNVKQVCNIIRCGGFYNFIFRSKLTFFGDGTHKIL